MEKQKRWHIFLITAVVLLTVYNILPTVFFYTKPLKEPITQTQAQTIAKDALSRVNDLEGEAVSWLKSYSHLLNIKSPSIRLSQDDPQLVEVTFKNAKEAELFRTHLPKAGALIPFIPAQLSLSPIKNTEGSKTVIVQRNIPIQFNTKDTSEYFQFTNKFENNQISPTYRDVLNDRLLQIGLTIAGPSENANLVDAIMNNQDSGTKQELLLALSHNILSYEKVFGAQSPSTKRLYSSLTQGFFENKLEVVENLTTEFDKLKDSLKLERIALQEKESKLKEKSQYLDNEEKQRLSALLDKETQISKTTDILKKNKSLFSSGANPLSYLELKNMIASLSSSQSTDQLNLGDHNPLIQKLTVDFSEQKVLLNFFPDILSTKTKLSEKKQTSLIKDRLDQILYNEIARISRVSREDVVPRANDYEVNLATLTNSKSVLIFNLSKVAEKESSQLKNLIEKNWNPKSKDLARETFQIWNYNEFQNLPASKKKLGLVIYSPSTREEAPPQGLKNNSIYVIAKGVDQILKKFKDSPDSHEAKLFVEDFNQLRDLLKNKGYYGYPGSTYPLAHYFSKDFIFEHEDFYSNILKATREDFKVYGTRKFATLEFTDYGQRILAKNQIENQKHEDLLKWRDEYHSAQVDPTMKTRFDIPKPTKNALLSNLALSFRKYFRGDERKIVKWGLDLSGGKTVQIELRDNNNKKVSNEADITQGINELYQRVNKMGVSEVNIRREGSNITLDFPGAQGLSASELVKASSMYFHVVNEKFSQNNPELNSAVNSFLQDVWNEAVVTNKKDIDSINRIAWNQLYGESLDTETVQPRSDAAKLLYENGLRLALPDEGSSNTFNETYSKITQYRGESFSSWQGQTNPLLIVFNNYALEGANLDNIHASYDPTKGNFLGFEVKSSQVSRDKQKINPRADLYAWTSAFSKEKITGTPAEQFSRGRGWRMAVILNGSVISAPALESALKDRAMITGSFTQREVNKLEADLKAGSLTFSPYILSEKNVSPELGIKERHQGILATVIALLLVMVTMIGYYRFAGGIAALAVIFNLLIMWATLQNIHAAMTLAGIAGIILTVGMAVDANVLVFERIREEFQKTGRLSLAINAGYKKAFSAIFDSNITTIIAAVILLQFDSGPIKAFAVMLIIGIVSSMFSALFMTKVFFQKWVQNPKNKALKFSKLFKSGNFNFLKYGKLGISISLIIALIGGAFMAYERHSILGMDFTGGFALNLEVEPQSNFNYRQAVENALLKSGISSQEIQVRELSPSNHIRIFLSKALDKPGHLFYGLPIENSDQELTFGYESNPRISWIIQALESNGIKITQKSLQLADSSWTSISGQISDTMRNNALIGLVIALACILLYITLRFEFKYALCATVGLAHDIAVTIASIAILHALKIPVQIDLNTIAALLTIVGYSLNDTIIIFDRIREDVKTVKKSSFRELVNAALNKTFSRTMMTSITTVLVLIALVALGGNTIFGFALVMTIGVAYGTLSSLFIATPLLHYLNKRELSKTNGLSYKQEKQNSCG